MTRILAIANQKGGVGKTTSVINLATALAACDRRTLIIDSDPQGNASTGFGIKYNERDIDLYSVICGKNNIVDSIKSTMIPKLDIITRPISIINKNLESLITHIRFNIDPVIQSIFNNWIIHFFCFKIID